MWSLPKPAAASEADNALVLRMSSLACLSTDERDVLQAVASLARAVPAQTDLCVEGQVQASHVLLSGWACYQRMLGDGRRQIVGFLLPGDLIGPVSRTGLPMPCSAQALTPVVVANAGPLLQAVDGTGPVLPGLATAVRRMAYADDVWMRDHVVRLGRQTAYERVVHLMLEIRSRLAVVGQVEDDGFAVPVTQEVLADALGLSVVHINRTLQQIRRDRLFELRSGRVKLRQVELMQTMADWAPAAG